MIEAGKNYLLFDGDCGICTRSVEFARRIDRAGRFVIAPYRSFSEADLAVYGISYDDCDRALQVITRKGRVYRGAFGVNYFLWRILPWSILVLLIYAVPILLIFELIGYRLVANNRHRISQWLGLTACKIQT